MLRYLSPARFLPQPKSRSEQGQGVELRLHAPPYGELFMIVHRLVDGTYERVGQDLNGELEIIIPPGQGGKRVRYITVGIKTLSELEFESKVDPRTGKIGRGTERDIIFHRRVLSGHAEAKGKGKTVASEAFVPNSTVDDDAGGIVLEEGSTRFAFTLVLPGLLALHDYHPKGRIVHILYAELSNQPPQPHLDFIVNGHSVRTPLYDSGLLGPPTTAIADAMSVSWNGSELSLSPSTASGSSDGNKSVSSSHSQGTTSTCTSVSSRTQRNQSDNDRGGHENERGLKSRSAEITWLKDKIKVCRPMYLVYNPNPDGGIITLDEYHQLFVEGLGLVQLRNTSPIWTVGTLLTTSFILPAPAPDCTIYKVQVSFTQKTSITSPRHSKRPPMVFAPDLEDSRIFVIWSEGVEPPSKGYTSNNNPSLWRGKQAGGRDEGQYEIKQRRRIPNEEYLRPSTLPDIVTPLVVSHILEMAVWYSIRGQTVDGKKTLPADNPGGIRLLRVTRPIVLPSCSIVPDRVDLPTYEMHASGKCDTWQLDQSIFERSCPVCKHHYDPDLDVDLEAQGKGLDIMAYKARCLDKCRMGMRRELTAMNGRDTIACACCWTDKEMEDVFDKLEKEAELRNGTNPDNRVGVPGKAEPGR